jgi:2-keto-4-pentenoate hydratase
LSTSGIDTNVVAQVAERVALAVKSGQPIPPVRDLLGVSDIALAYAVQKELTRDRVANGAKVVGRKIGLTSAAVQQQLGVDQPDFGVLFADMDVSDWPEVPPWLLLQPKAEAEVAFVLGQDLIEGDLDDEQVGAAVDYALPALEIVDSRIANWDISITDTVADNASSGLFAVGNTPLALENFSPRDVRMQMHCDDELVSEGSGAACLGDPLNALRWLARISREFGEPLRAGQIILSGALGPMVPVTPGNHIRAHIDPLGSVSVKFSSEGTGSA